MFKLILVLLAIYIPDWAYASNDKYFLSEQKNIQKLLDNSISTETINKVAANAVKSFRSFRGGPSKIEKYMEATYKNFISTGQPEIIYDAYGPWYYQVPIMDNKNNIAEYLIISATTGRILEYPSFSKNGYLAAKEKPLSNAELIKKVENQLNIRTIGEIRKHKILLSRDRAVNYYSVRTDDDKILRTTINKKSEVVYIDEKIFDKELYILPDRQDYIDNLKIRNLDKIQKREEDAVNYVIGDFNIDNGHLIPEYDILPWKNQKVNNASHVNANLAPTKNEWSNTIALKCLSYGSASIADWWSYYTLEEGTINDQYKSILRGSGSNFEIEYGVNPRLLELVYHENYSVLSFDFDFAPFYINCPATGDEIAFDLKGYCRILTHDNIDYIEDPIDEPLFGNVPSEFQNYYQYTNDIHYGCGENWGILSNWDAPENEDYQRYKNRMISNGPLLIWASCLYENSNWLTETFEITGHSMAAIGIGQFNGDLYYYDGEEYHHSESEDYVLICHDNYGVEQYTPKTLSNGEQYFGVWEAYYFHDETQAPYVQSHTVSSERDTDIKIIFNESMKPEILESTGNPVVSVSGNNSYSFNTDYNRSTKILTIDPYPDFNYSENITVTVSTDAQDVAGNNMSGPYQFQFTIQNSPGPDPTSISVSMSLEPSTTTPNSTVTVSGSAIYDTGNPVSDGTAEIHTSENIWTAALDANGNFTRVIYAPGSSGYVTVYVSDGNLPDGSAQQYLTVQQDGDGDNYDFYRSTMCQDVQSGDPYDPINETQWFRSDDEIAYCWIHLQDLYVPVKAKWVWFDPNGDEVLDPTYSDYTDDPKDFGYDYWYWWKLWSGYYIDGYSQSDREGRHTVKIYVREEGESYEYMETQTYIISYDFKEHKMCKDVQENDPWNPIDPTNTFLQTDDRAYTWSRYTDVTEAVEAKVEWYEPNGSLYLESEYTIADPGQGYYYPESKQWDWIDINGYSAANKCGDWNLKKYEKDPWGNWDLIYEDYFQILEQPAEKPTASVNINPTNPMEAQGVSLVVNVTDNTYLKKVELHWNDGTLHSRIWNNIYSSTFNHTENIGSFSGGQQISYWVKAWDTSDNLSESNHYTITIAYEQISLPNQPSGENICNVDETYTYTTGGSTSSLGHEVEYQFDWADGQVSNWGGESQSHAWSNPDNYLIKTRARCTVHTDRLSAWSNAFLVTVSSSVPCISGSIIYNNTTNRFNFCEDRQWVEKTGTSNPSYIINDNFDSNDGSWTEYDPDAKIELDYSNDQRLEFSNWFRYDEGFVQQGVTPLSNFDLEYAFSITGKWGNAKVVGPCISDTYGSLTDIENLSGNGIYLLYYAGQDQGGSAIYIRAVENGVNTTDWTPGGDYIHISMNQTYYVTFEKNGDDLTLNIYSDQSKTNHISGSPISVTTDFSTTTFNNFYAINSWVGTAGDLEWTSGWIDDIKLSSE